MVNVTYDSNNSGGSWWLSDNDWYNLESNGWNVEWVADKAEEYYGGDRWLGALATRASKAFNNPADAISEFEYITGQTASDVGCNCCGPPHNFEYEDEDGHTHYASAYVSATDIAFD